MIENKLIEQFRCARTAAAPALFGPGGGRAVHRLEQIDQLIGPRAAWDRAAAPARHRGPLAPLSSPASRARARRQHVLQGSSDERGEGLLEFSFQPDTDKCPFFASRPRAILFGNF